jgi:prepilin-type N-terminal cleavage/methylation domain-containing protein
VSRLARLPASHPVSPQGLTLLEVMVALVIVAIAAGGFLEIFVRVLRSTADAHGWAKALVYAEQGQEMVKIDGVASAAARPSTLLGGFTRRIAVRRWRYEVDRVTVTVTLPDGRRFDLDRLVPPP